jgi:hypothetical protein
MAEFKQTNQGVLEAHPDPSIPFRKGRVGAAKHHEMGIVAELPRNGRARHEPLDDPAVSCRLRVGVLERTRGSRPGLDA